VSANENGNTSETVPRFEAINRQQLVLRPVDIEELIEPHHPARNIWEFLGQLELSRFAAEVKSVEGHAGRSAWEPRLLISMWLYAYSRGISSAREIERQCQYEPGLQWLTGLQVVNHHTLSDFRVQQGEALKQLFVQVLGILHLKKLITLERVTQDGTKVRANVNKKTFTRESKIRAHLQLAEQQVQKMEAAEEQEKRTRQAAAKKRAQRERQERLRQALEEVQRLQKQKKWEKNKPCQASVTDADAQFMRTGDHGLAPCYNVQLTTDAVHGLIVGVGVSKDPSDAAHLMPAMERVKQTLGRYPHEVVADGDYTNRESVIAAAERGVDFYGSWSVIDGKPGHGIEPDFHPRMFTYDERRNEFICPQGKRLSYRTTQRGPGGAEDHVFVARQHDCQACPKRTQCTPNNRMQKHGRAIRVRLEDERVERFKDKMGTAEAKAIYRQRSRIAEFPHAWLKCKLNFVRLRSRGLTKATTEAFWVCLTHNLQRYFGLQRLQAA
jgi:transposase